MADKKISALTASSTPLAGTEVLPIVQSGATVKVSVVNLTAGRAISATEVTLSTGNLVIGTAAKGIDFSANTNAPGMTSEVLSRYEEGVFTATLTCTSGTITLNSAQDQMQYTRIGRMVFVSGQIVVNAVSSPTGILTFNGLPYTVNGSLGELSGRGAATIIGEGVSATITNVVSFFLTGGTSLNIYKYAAGATSNMAADVNSTSSFIINMWYVAA